MANAPMVSIIVPVYNAEDNIERCLNSIIKQDYSNFELIIVDDGSEDNSLHICKKMALLNKRIQVYHKSNGGVSSARNLGISKARGEYICFVDADDWIDSDYLSFLMRHRQPYGLVASDIYIDNEVIVNANVNSNLHINNLSIAEAEISVFSTKNGMHGFPFNKLFYRKLLIENNIYFDESITICEDTIFALQYILHISGKILFSNKKIYHYTKNDTGATNSRFTGEKAFNPRQLTEFAALDKAREFIIDDEKVISIWKVRRAKAAVNTLRVLYAYGLQNIQKYKNIKEKLRKTICAELIHCLRSSYVINSGKISILLSAISPALELFVWRWHNRK